MAQAGRLPREPGRARGRVGIGRASIEEPRRIAAVLDAADALRAKRREALAKLDTLTQSIFVAVFGDPVTNPRSWPDSRVDGVLEHITYGHRFDAEKYSASGNPVVRITDLNEMGALDFESIPRMALTSDEHERYRVRPGDRLFARSGATVGKVVSVRDGDPDRIAGTYFVWMRFSDQIAG